MEREESMKRTCFHFGQGVQKKPALSPICAAVLISFVSSVRAATIVDASTTGQILSTDTAYQLNAGTTVSTTSGDAIRIEGIAPATISNSGSILSSLDYAAAGIRFSVSGSLTNETTGLIHGNTFGVAMDGGGTGNNVVNYGDISVSASHAVYYCAATSGTLDNYGTLNSGNAGSVGSSADGVYVHGAGTTVTINNHANAAIRSGTGDPVYGQAIVVDAGAVTVNNDGLIDGYHGGIAATSPDAIHIVNSSTGTIRGEQGPGVQMQQGSDITNRGAISSTNGAAILLTGANNTVVLGTGSALGGGGNAAIVSQGTGNQIQLIESGTESGDFNATNGNGFASLVSAAGSNWTLTGNVSMGGSNADAVQVSGNLTLGGTVTIDGSAGTRIFTGGHLTLGTGAAGGSVTGNIANDGVLEFNRSDNFTLAGALSGVGSLIKNGSGITALTGAGSTQSAVNVNTGALLFAQDGAFTVTGDHVTAAGATTAISGRSSLSVGNHFAMNGALDVAAGSVQPTITASTATIAPGATFNLIGYTAAATASVSDLASGAFTVIHATTAGGLTGTFQTVKLGGSQGQADYLTLTSSYTPQSYIVGLGLTWYAAHSTSPQTAHGTFTLAGASDTFNLDAVMADEAANAATGWDGKTLTKAGAGTLQLSKPNTYTGATIINGGTLLAGTENIVSTSSQVTVGAGATFDLNGFNQTVNNISGAGNVALGSATLTANTTVDGVLSGVISGSGGLTKAGAATLTLAGGPHTYAGATMVNAGALVLANGAQLANTSQVTVSQGATFGGYGSVGGSVVNNGLLAVADAAPGFAGGPAGTFVVGGALTNNGEIRMGSPVPASTLTVNGNYVGNNGRMTLWTALGADNAATDRLVVHGNTSGQTAVRIENAGGAGAPTSNGIRIVQVDGQSDGVFALDGRVVAGAYEYNLYKGSPAAPNDGNWYLRSFSTDPTPQIRPEPGAYLANQSAAQGMFIHTLHDRAGFADPARSSGSAPETSTVWARATGGHSDGNAAAGRISESADTALVQVGIDLLHRVANNQRWQAGIMAGYGTGTTHATASNNPAIARGTVNGVNGGLYATWHGNATDAEGPYADTWMQYSHFDNTVKGSSLDGTHYTSQVWSGSVEGGWAFRIGQTGVGTVMLEPQFQLIYTDYRSDSHTERNGTVIQDSSSGGWTTRLGTRLYHTPAAGTAPDWLPFVELNWWHNGSGNAIAFNNTVIAQDGPTDRVEVKAGAQIQVAQRWRMWGHIAYQYGNGGFESITGLLGARYLW